MYPVSVDSLEVFIPTTKTIMQGRSTEVARKLINTCDLEILDKRLESAIIEIYESNGEERNRKFNQPLVFEENGIKTTYKIVKKSYGSYTLTGISLGVSSKIIKSDYLKGINKETISLVYNEIIKQRIIKISLEDFLRSKVRMVDIKKDGFQDNVEDSINEIKSRIKSSIKYNYNYRDGNITIGKRSLANNTSLYIKFYNKSNELASNSYNFSSTFLNDHCLDNLLRTEITMFSRYLKEYFHGFDGSLDSILHCVGSQGEYVMSKILSNYLSEAGEHKFASNDSIKPDELAVRIELLVSELMFNPKNRRMVNMQNKVLSIIKPSRNKTSRVKRLVEYYFDKIIHDELSVASNK